MKSLATIQPEAPANVHAQHSQHGANPGKLALPSVLGRILGVVKQGVALTTPAFGLFADFFAIPAQSAVDVSLSIVTAFTKIGIVLLTSEQRLALAQQISGPARAVATEVATALTNTPEVEQGTGVQGQVLEQRMQQEDALVSIGKSLSLALGLVGDARFQLQGWQFVAQRRVLNGLFQEFVSAPTTGDRLQIVADAGPALEALEQEFQALQDTRSGNAATDAVLAEDQQRVANDLLMVQTMRAVREGQPVDPDLLQRMALYYDQRVPPSPTVVPPSTPAPATGKSKKAKPPKKKTPPASGSSGPTVH